MMKIRPEISTFLLLSAAVGNHRNLIVAALKCGGPLTSECLGASDKRYDPYHTNALAEQSAAWANGMLTGLSKGKITSYTYDDDGTASKAWRVPYNVTRGTFGMPGEFLNLVDAYYFWNATITGSRYERTGVVITRPVCKGGGPPPGVAVGGPPPGVVAGGGTGGGPPAGAVLVSSTNSSNTGDDAECNSKQPGKAIPYNLWGTSTYEKDGTLRLFMGSGYYTATKETFFIPQDDSTLYMMSRNRVAGTGPATVQSSGDHIAYEGGERKMASTSVYDFRKSGNPLNVHSISQSDSAPDKEGFLQSLLEAYEEYNIPSEERITFDEEAGACVFPDQCVTEEDYCTVGMDPECSVSPYQEPAASLTAGGVVLIALCCAALVLGVAFLVFRKLSEDQKYRYKTNFVRGIAMNITIAPTAGMVDAEQLKKEFDFMDKDGGGTICKKELKAWLDSGKAGDISDKDFQALWSAIDVDNSGEVDFVEFIGFLGSCGTQFDAVNKEQRAMTKEQRMNYASQRLSARVLQIPKGDSNNEESGGAAEAAEDKA
ncbi:hypothetical protein THAOC_17670 [Thalassiosira oceanica]|uniref:EF-hand domain-containing protein n=1 Tax=Thalassiosira oceanica TaxID=159749 RepID=K0S917_THAOC|nr:hypothetical protein THAOC_17670 [Thalassiosira oceanica]|eukprot:EJK61780.1 hypothetical protein THAOC_17670 [Thalassiosira oceanica]